MYQIVNMKDHTGGIEEAIKYYFSKWGSTFHYKFFQDAIIHSTNAKVGLPRFYALIKKKMIVGCCGLVSGDFISRDDLFPWLAGLYVEESERGQALGNHLMGNAEEEARICGYSEIYLTTDHNGYYEKYGWERIEDGYDLKGKPSRIYMKHLQVDRVK